MRPSTEGQRLWRRDACSRLARLQIGPGLAAGERQIGAAHCARSSNTRIGEIEIGLAQLCTASHQPAAADASRASGLYVGRAVADQNGGR